MSLDRWRALSGFLPADASPAHHNLGVRYPWRDIALHTRTQALARRVDEARRVVDFALSTDHGWTLGLSGGKDSTALALLAPSLPAVSVKDDLDYPGEVEYLRALVARTGHALRVLTPPTSLVSFLRETRPSLVEDLHGRAAELSARWFYSLLDADRIAHGYGGVLLGLRAQESRGRRLNVATHGTVYQRADGLRVAQPLANWSALDVHAYLWREGWPVLPVYLCIDPEQDPLSIRKSWWVCGGGPARRGSHYGWLRRWWPTQWRIACEIDPSVRAIS